MIALILFKQKTAYEILSGLVGSEMCIRDRYDTSYFISYYLKACFMGKSKDPRRWFGSWGSPIAGEGVLLFPTYLRPLRWEVLLVKDEGNHIM